MHPLDLIQHILDTHHALLHRELPRLSAALSKPDVPAALQEAWRELAEILELHLMKEERILFPAIEALYAGAPLPPCGVQAPIRQMNHEHEIIGMLEQRLREVAHLAGEHTPAIEALLDDLVVHATREDEELFPAVVDAAQAVA